MRRSNHDKKGAHVIELSVWRASKGVVSNKVTISEDKEKVVDAAASNFEARRESRVVFECANVLPMAATLVVSAKNTFVKEQLTRAWCNFSSTLISFHKFVQIGKPPSLGTVLTRTVRHECDSLMQAVVRDDP